MYKRAAVGETVEQGNPLFRNPLEIIFFAENMNQTENVSQELV